MQTNVNPAAMPHSSAVHVFVGEDARPVVRTMKPQKDEAMLEKRIDELEMRLAHQDKTISELNDVITEQWKKLEMVERQLRLLGEELQAMEGGDAPAANQKPPHY